MEGGGQAVGCALNCGRLSPPPIDDGFPSCCKRLTGINGCVVTDKFLGFGFAEIPSLAKLPTKRGQILVKVVPKESKISSAVR